MDFATVWAILTKLEVVIDIDIGIDIDVVE